MLKNLFEGCISNRFLAKRTALWWGIWSRRIDANNVDSRYKSQKYFCIVPHNIKYLDCSQWNFSRSCRGICVGYLPEHNGSSPKCHWSV